MGSAILCFIMATNTPIFIIVTNHSDDSIPVSTLVANFMKKAMVKDLVKELAYDTVNDLVIDSAIVLAEDLSKEEDDSVKVFSLVYEFLKQIQPLELEEKKTIELAKELLKGLVKALTKRLTIEFDGKMAKWQGIIDTNEKDPSTSFANGVSPIKPRRGSVTQRNPR